MNVNTNGRERPRMAASTKKRDALTSRQETAALALSAGRTETEAARRSGAGARTIRTWLATHPAFGRRVRELRAEMTSRALGRLVDSMTSAADTLGFLARKGKTEKVRLAAARAVLELGVKLRDSVELEERIAALEQTQSPNTRNVA